MNNKEPGASTTQEIATVKVSGHAEIWLKVSNVRFGEKKVEVQLEGDRSGPDPYWWHVGEYSDEEANKAFNTISKGLENGKLVLAKIISQKNGTLICETIRVQYHPGRQS